MKKEQNVVITSIEYNNDKEASNNLIKFIINSLLENNFVGDLDDRN